MVNKRAPREGRLDPDPGRPTGTEKPCHTANTQRHHRDDEKTGRGTTRAGASILSSDRDLRRRQRPPYGPSRMPSRQRRRRSWGAWRGSRYRDTTRQYTSYSRDHPSSIFSSAVNQKKVGGIPPRKKVGMACQSRKGGDGDGCTFSHRRLPIKFPCRRPSRRSCRRQLPKSPPRYPMIIEKKAGGIPPRKKDPPCAPGRTAPTGEDRRRDGRPSLRPRRTRGMRQG